MVDLHEGRKMDEVGRWHEFSTSDSSDLGTTAFSRGGFVVAEERTIKKRQSRLQTARGDRVLRRAREKTNLVPHKPSIVRDKEK